MGKKKMLTLVALVAGAAALIFMLFTPILSLQGLDVSATGSDVTFDAAEGTIMGWLPLILLAVGVGFTLLYFLLGSGLFAGLAGSCYGLGGVLTAGYFILNPLVETLMENPDLIGDVMEAVFEMYSIGWGAIVCLICAIAASGLLGAAKKAD